MLNNWEKTIGKVKRCETNSDLIPTKTKGPLFGNANYYFGNIACVSFQISEARRCLFVFNKASVMCLWIMKLGVSYSLRLWNSFFEKRFKFTLLPDYLTNQPAWKFQLKCNLCKSLIVKTVSVILISFFLQSLSSRNIRAIKYPSATHLNKIAHFLDKAFLNAEYYLFAVVLVLANHVLTNIQT